MNNQGLRNSHRQGQIKSEVQAPLVHFQSVSLSGVCLLTGSGWKHQLHEYKGTSCPVKQQSITTVFTPLSL